MAKRFLVPLSVNGLASDPASGSEGDIYFNTVSKSLKIYKNDAWEELGGAGNESASILNYVNNQLDDTYDLIFEGQYTDDIEEGVSNLYFTEERAQAAVGGNVAAASAFILSEANAYTDNQTIDFTPAINSASSAATASAFTYTDEQIALVENDPTNISFVRWNKIISGSATVISGLDDDNETLDYIPTIEQVFINGSFIDKNSYTATNGSSITFDEPLNDTDVVEVLCLKTTLVITQDQLATSINRWTKVMSASTSTISGVDDYSNTLDYSIGYTTVFVNGVLIDISEYTATSGSAIVFDTEVKVDDVVEVLSYRSVGYINDFYSLLNSASAAGAASAISYTNNALANIDLTATIITASAAAAAYTDSEVATAIITASAAAAAYTDSEISTIDLTATIVTASTAAYSSASAYTNSEINNLTTTDIEEGTNLYFTNERSVNAGSSTYILQINEQDIINSASTAAVNYLVDGAPGALDTLNELAEALNDNADILDLYLTQSSASVLYEPEIPYVSASPSAPVAGTLWIDSTNAAAPSLKVYNGSEWIAVSGAASESGFHPFFGAYK